MNYNELVESILQKQKNAVLYREDFMSNAVDVALAVGGLAPGVGEFFDITLAIRYAKRGEHLNAVLCLISCIPMIGDLIGKGALTANLLAKLASYTRTQGKLGRAVAKGITNTRGAVQQASPIIIDLKRRILENKYVIKKLLNRAKRHKTLGQYANDMEEALNAFLRVPKNYTLSSQEDSSLDSSV